MAGTGGTGSPGKGTGGGAGRLVVAGVPLGDVEDASPRLRRTLAEAPVIAAEDTRRLHRLAASLGISLTGRTVSYFEGNEVHRAAELVALLCEGQSVVLLTDGGMPTVSDPGYRLVAAAVAAGVPVTVVPGPSAVTAALAVSGLPTDRFCFEGFLPRKAGDRRARLRRLASEPRTLVFFESPRRVAITLRELVSAFGGDRRAAVCRELTKTYEEVRRDRLDALAEWAAAGVLGEVTLVVAGAPGDSDPPEPAELVRLVDGREAAGQARKEAIAAVARDAGVPKRAVFDAVVAARHERNAAGVRSLRS